MKRMERAWHEVSGAAGVAALAAVESAGVRHRRDDGRRTLTHCSSSRPRRKPWKMYKRAGKFVAPRDPFAGRE
ncbi:hypothetical protein [Burkholderia vietnamiensis]|uniref:hypothetical protein n=1 Tax=Burkholderia vietnamiensis TaxID=60552 RepID=UPI000A423DA0|nr:hypothetical protein [Burkholderia vietnamiensis]MCA7982353.1 hypothetical protein [Burkholderia vietnamiensis]HDR8930023.1 hypothetical protein [Burkholderia vietnamiensis]